METTTEKFTMLDKFGMIFSDPKIFFRKTKAEKDIGGSLLMYVVVSLIAGIASSLFYIMFGSTTRMFLGVFGGFTLFFSISGVISTFFYSGVMHLLLITTEKNVNYVDTYNIFTYSLVPAIIFSIIPLGFFAVIYSLVLMIIGMSEVHGISHGRASFIVLMPFFVVVSFIILVAISFIMVFGLL